MDVKKLFDYVKLLPAWARIVVIACLAAAFVALTFCSCAVSSKVQKNGVHIDTVRVDYIIRSNNYNKVMQ